ncbi:MAG: helix-turn-helix transcriptional regulator [Cytophagales bacterium]|nr:helix-turn-helix transcriptional regulator [Armatimonadota bacterium]
MARDLPRGDIPTLILATLTEGSRHGYAIAREVERVSQNALHLREGSLYPALRVLEQDGLVTSEWVTPPGGGQSRRVYSLTDEGRAELTRRTHDWRQYAAFMNSVLGGRKDGEQQA